MKLVEGKNASLEAEVASLRREVNLRNGAAKVQLEAKHEALKDAKEAYGELVPTLEKLNSAEAESARLREEINRSEGRVKIKQERIVRVKNELEDQKEAAEELAQSLQASRTLTKDAIEKCDQLRRELRKASIDPCMCCGNSESRRQRNFWPGCGHIVCYDCLEGDVHQIGVDKSSKPVLYELRGYCACKVQGCKGTSREALMLNGTCPPV
ncbi:hypothetical protein THAOC_01480 [Thalassiosira oceanica]|uniref:RING-type domain-containing protein n=1 Tax=Thalassiosira oceanica TaxID=159749 RepID=K0TQW2_THAOC|nr:hypothetical protein THAOC_01480 [Thalassiosira oceanica]|eukprot:EJK76742.1 hypothetical protein THAOC_01480 [Thalassiosira oceanica]